MCRVREEETKVPVFDLPNAVAGVRRERSLNIGVRSRAEEEESARERGANDDDDGGQKTRAHVIIIYCLEKKTRCKTGVVMGAVYDNYGARARHRINRSRPRLIEPEQPRIIIMCNKYYTDFINTYYNV